MRRSPRLACPLSQLGYDEIEVLVPYLSIKEAFVLMQTCRSMFILVFRAVICARVSLLRRWHGTFQHTIDRSEYLQVEELANTKYKFQMGADKLVELVADFEWFHSHVVQFQKHSTHSAYLYTARRDRRLNRILEMASGFRKLCDGTDQLLQKVEHANNDIKGTERIWIAASPEARAAINAKLAAVEEA